MPFRIVEIQQGILRKNDALASGLRERFAVAGTYVINLLSSPGAGKTTLLEETLRQARPRLRCAALVGDQATDNDAVRLARSGAPVRQITTGPECRLDASMIERALDGWLPDDVDLLCVENVGNLICPAEYDLGEDLRVALFSVTEGEDKPLKYPLAFNTSHLALITKTDLAQAVAFDRPSALQNVQAVHPGIPIIELSARTGAGFDSWMNFLESRVSVKRAGKRGRSIA
ncbi:MAG: hydrogenase nickel incorporation protein HypB [Candidatus Eremiobacteraeota bacterium]|nr:hydrogenase nickel incorporation protein HypB [Candidatus Eremiobacteraeota bacterium]MBC5828358.1 hydrogenase nickel incorporation protein HypB [Candidatus Eremiobacteraeota bacterium]